MKGPAIFLAQFVKAHAPFNSLPEICKWAADYGYEGIQIPTWENKIIDLEQAAQSKVYCDELKGVCADSGLEITELSTHFQGQLIAVHPAYDILFDGFAPELKRANPAARTEWARRQLFFAAEASKNLGLLSHATFSGSLLWHTFYPWPPRPAGLVDEGFRELASRWRPILDAFDKAGVDVCYELHPGEDLHDGISYERFLEAVGGHSRANILYDPSHFLLQQMDYLSFIDIYHDRIKMFHVKDAEFRQSGRSGLYGGYQGWIDRPGRFRSLGDGQIDFPAIFSKLTQYGFEGWAVVEWECCLKNSEDGAREGAVFVKNHMIRTDSGTFDDFADGEIDNAQIRQILGLNKS